MPRLVNTLPKFRRHASGQAFVQIGGKNFYLGRYGTSAARLAYDAFIQRWLAAGRPGRMDHGHASKISALILGFWRECKSTLSKGELHPLKSALKVLRAEHGNEPAVEFGPKKLKQLLVTMAGNPHEQ